ncbi:MAG: hypothetical protein QXO70_01155, partial [Candidatus Pacearchaeota archaeon]
FSLTHKFDIAGHEGYMTVGLYPNGKIGEVFITMAKEGSFVSGVMDQWATSLSIGLQYGIPLSDYTKKMIGSKFEPSGFVNKTNNEGEIDKIVKEKEIAHSIMDYLGDWLNKLEEAVEKKEILLPIKNGIQSAVTENQKTMLEDKNKILIDNKEKENKTSEDYSEGLICKICGAPAKRTNSKCGIICINNHIDDSGCAG